MNPLPEVLAPEGVCVQCGLRIKAELCVHVCSDNNEKYQHIKFFNRCPACDKQNPFQVKMWLPNGFVMSKLTREQVEKLPKREYAENKEKCVRCGIIGCQLHHWAPTAIFGEEEANLWPTSWLCKSCHDRWHETMETAIIRQHYE